MGFDNRYPYTDMHELNLDWILEQMKTLAAAWDAYQESLTGQNGEWPTFKAYIENEWQTYQDGLTGVNGQWPTFKAYMENAWQSYQDSLTGVNGAWPQFKTQMETEWQQFFDNYIQTLGVVQVTGSSTTSVMSQKAVTDIIENEYTNFTMTQGGYVNPVGNTTLFAQFSYSNFIDISNVNAIYINISDAASIAYYDVNQIFISSVQGTVGAKWYYLEPPVNAKYVRFSNNSQSTPDTDVKTKMIASAITSSNILERIIADEVTLSDISKCVKADIQISMAQSAPYDDLNTFPVNTIVAITANVGISNMPSVTGQGTVITLSKFTTAESMCIVQFIFNNVNEWYWRTKWAAWSTWTKIGSQADIDAVKAMFVDEYTNFVMTPNGYINPSGAVISYPSFSYSDYIEVSKVNRIYAGMVDAAVLAYYTKDKTFISYVSGTTQSLKTYDLQPPVNAFYLRFSSYTASGNPKCYYNITPYSCSRTEQRIDNISDKIDTLEESNAQRNVLAMFDGVTCCGDSLTYSQVYTGENTTRQAVVTYPQCLSKLTGTTVREYATPGASAQSWWASYGTNINQADLYIIYLGTNLGLTDTIDTDCVGNDPDNFANTNTGCYGKMLQTIKNNNYTAVLIKCRESSGNVTVTNEVIDKFALKYDFPVISIPNSVTNMNYHYYPHDTSGYNIVHYNDLGYSYLAYIINKQINSLPDSDLIKIAPYNPS